MVPVGRASQPARCRGHVFRLHVLLETDRRIQSAGRIAVIVAREALILDVPTRRLRRPETFKAWRSLRPSGRYGICTQKKRGLTGGGVIAAPSRLVLGKLFRRLSRQHCMGQGPAKPGVARPVSCGRAASQAGEDGNDCAAAQLTERPSAEYSLLAVVDLILFVRRFHGSLVERGDRLASAKMTNAGPPTPFLPQSAALLVVQLR